MNDGACSVFGSDSSSEHSGFAGRAGFSRCIKIAVDYDDLPAVDREPLDALLPPPEDRADGDGSDGGGLDAAVTRVYSDVKADERGVVEEAVDGGYYEGSTHDAFESVVRRFRDHRALEADERGDEWLPRYEGTVYWAELQHPPSALEG